MPVICYPDLNVLAVQQATTPRGVQSSNAALGALWSSSTVFANTCYQAIGQNGSLIGTAFVARDMLQIADTLEEDGLLRYWGMCTLSALNPSFADLAIRFLLWHHLGRHGSRYVPEQGGEGAVRWCTQPSRVLPRIVG